MRAADPNIGCQIPVVRPPHRAALNEEKEIQTRGVGIPPFVETRLQTEWAEHVAT